MERQNGLYLLLQVLASEKGRSKKKKDVRIGKELLLAGSKILRITDKSIRFNTHI